MNVVLVDSGGANIGSVRYALQRLGVEAALTSDAAAIRGHQLITVGPMFDFVTPRIPPIVEHLTAEIMAADAP